MDAVIVGEQLQNLKLDEDSEIVDGRCARCRSDYVVQRLSRTD